jgi:hypothetical protein
MKPLHQYIQEAFSNMPRYDFEISTNKKSKLFGILRFTYNPYNNIECSLEHDGTTTKFEIPYTMVRQFWMDMWSARDDRWKRYGSAPIMKFDVTKGAYRFALIEPARSKADFVVELLDEKSNVELTYRFTIQDLLIRMADHTNNGDVENLDNIIRK